MSLSPDGRLLATSSGNSPVKLCDYLGSMALDGSASYEHDAGSLVQWAWDLTGNGSYTDAYGVGPSVTWDYLVNTLGLTPGSDHPIGLKVLDDDGEWSTPAYTPLFIAVPEPASITLLGAGALGRIIHGPFEARSASE